MARRFHLLAALLALPLALGSCKINTINSFPTTYAQVRFINAMADAPALDVSEGGNKVWPGVNFETGTGYLDFLPSNTSFGVALTGTATTLVSAGYSLFGTQPYTLIAYGYPTAASLLMAPDDTIVPGNGQFKLRVTNVAAGVGTIDTYVTAPGVDITNVAPAFNATGYGISTISLQFPAGQYQVRITPYATKTVIYDSGPLTLADQRSAYAIVYTKRSSLFVNVLLADEDGDHAVAPVNNLQARIKAIHAAPQTGAVNLLSDGVSIVPGEIYLSASSYVGVSPGTKNLAFEDASAPGAILAAATKTIGASTDSSVFLTGFPGSLKAVTLDDDNLPSSTGQPKVRFVNASPDAPPLDVVVGTNKVVSALASPTASTYALIDAGTYTVTFNDAATGTALLTVPNVVLTLGQTSTFYVVGAVGGLAPLITQDR
ncbi:MAG: DUF4397 domain-containing protein [Betaproteobacteria bacterium]